MTIALLATTLALAGCGGDDAPDPDATSAATTLPAAAPAAAPAAVTVTATDYAFELPEEVSAGLVTFEMPNRGGEAHHAQLVRVLEGGSLDAALAALAEEDLATMFDHVVVAGGVGVVAPGGSAAATVSLAPGAYAFLCVLPSPDGTPHVAKGMLQTFAVTGDAPSTTPPDTVGTVTLDDFTFGLPDDVDGTVAVSNSGQQPHELLLIQLAEGVGLEEGLAALEGPPGDGPPPAIPAGGLQAIMPGQTGYLDLGELASGEYALVCFLPDPASGQSHVELGMVGQLRIG